jgi:hypothetical protein
MNHDHRPNDSRSLRQAIIARVQDIRAKKNRGRSIDAMQAAQDAIVLILETLGLAVLSRSSRAEVIAILNISTKFCAVQLADEEALNRQSGGVPGDANVAARRRLLTRFVAARRRATGEGLSVATLDFVDLLHDLHEHEEAAFRGHRKEQTARPSHASHGS